MATVTLLVPGALWNQMEAALRALPDAPLGTDQLLTDDFLLAREGRLAVYWCPFERLNSRARVAIVGLTPGWAQMRQAVIAARDAARANCGLDEIMDRVDRAAAFVGPMRINMVRMLDAIGLDEALGISSTAALFEDRDDLVHTTSALRYPVFVAGRNYGGANPAVERSELLRGYVHNLLAPELDAVERALIIPLGKAVEGCLGMVVDDGQLDIDRCLFGFPHPSGGNGHRVRQFREGESQLREAVWSWAKSYAPSTSDVGELRVETDTAARFESSRKRR